MDGTATSGIGARHGWTTLDATTAPKGELGAPPDGLHWHTDGFTALVGPAFPLMSGSDGRARTSAAFDAAITACRALLNQETIR